MEPSQLCVRLTTHERVLSPEIERQLQYKNRVWVFP